MQSGKIPALYFFYKFVSLALKSTHVNASLKNIYVTSIYLSYNKHN